MADLKFAKVDLAKPWEDNFFALLTQDGAGVVSTATGDYSGGEVYWECRPGPNRVIALYTLIVLVQDAGNFDAGKYGNNITLTNGIDVQLVRGTGSGATVISTFGSSPVKKSADWAFLCYETRIDNYGTGDNFLIGRWNFMISGCPIRADGREEEAFRLVLHDDFTGLNDHRFMNQGVRHESVG